MRGEFLKASAARFFSVGATLASGLVSLKLYGHFFTPDIYGVMVVALQLIGYLPMLDGGFRMATNRRLLAADSNERDHLLIFSQEIYSWLLLLGLAAGTLLMSGYAFLPHARPGGDWTLPLFIALGCCGAFAMFASAQAGLLLGVGAQAAMAVVAGISSLLGVMALAAALSLGGGLWAFPISILFSGISTYGLALVFLHSLGLKIPLLRFTLNREFRRLFDEIHRDAWRAFRSQISIVMVFSMDLVIASFFCKPAEVAIYGVVSRVLGIGRSFLLIFNESAWPFVAARAHGVDRFQDGIVRANAWLHGLAGGGMAVLLSEFVTWYMGPEWRPPTIIVWLFVVRFVIIGVAGPASYYLLGKGDFRSVAKCTEYELLACVGLSLALAPKFGLVGIATGFLAGTIGGTLLPFWIFYARQRGVALAPLLALTWMRVAVGFAAGLALAMGLLRILPWFTKTLP